MDAHILALETSSNLCELTLLSRTQAGISLVELSHEGSGDHAERLLPMAEQLLEQAGRRRRRGQQAKAGDTDGDAPP